MIRARAWVWRVYRCDAVSGVLVRVSIGRDGFNDNDNVDTGGSTNPLSLESVSPRLGVLGAGRGGDVRNGQYVFFESLVALTAVW